MALRMSIKIELRPEIELGIWQGMGGAITEATAYNFAKLRPARQRALLEAYYGKDGLDYRWGRISVGSNDFCLKSFEYTKRRDLSDFSIEHDEEYVLPMLKKILSKKQLHFVASPWSPPSCMKTTRVQRFGGHLKPWCFEDYAKYLRLWLETYAEQGVKVDYLVPQNEPFAVQIWESCLYSLRAQRKLAYKYLAQELDDLDVQILLWDHNKRGLTKIADGLFNGSHVTEVGYDKKVAGLCYHWYNGTHANEMWHVRQKYPDILMLSSEMCCGYSPYDAEEWKKDGALYLRELMADINCGTSAWIDWNMLLSWRGGPSYCKNFVKSPVILNETEDDFVLTPIYDALKEFAWLFPAGSKVLRCECDSDGVAVVARKLSGGVKCELVLANLTPDEQEVECAAGSKHKAVRLAGFELTKISF